MAQTRVFGRRSLLVVLAILLVAAFLGITLLSYFVSQKQIHDAIVENELPLTSSNVYSEIQKDLVRPVLVSSTMAQDTFLRDWVLRGENNVDEISRYLMEVRRRYGAFSSFFVSEKTGNYYTGKGVLKRVRADEPRDVWYYRVRDMKEDYEVNVDIDMANADALTIFINYRVFDYDGRYIGATGIGLTADAVSRLITDYQQRFERTIYFVDKRGQIVQFGAGRAGQSATTSDLRTAAGLGPLVPGILAEHSGAREFVADGDNHILHFNYLPELNWYLFVEQNESATLTDVRRVMWTNVAISLGVTLTVLLLAFVVLGRYQYRIEEMASTDKLTGLLNRHAFAILVEKLLAEQRRGRTVFSILLVDIDHFKAINDRHGHGAGDVVLREVAHRLQERLRASDLAVRWGGEEFLLLLKDCHAGEAYRMAEALCALTAATPVSVAGAAIAVTVSIGLAEYDGTQPVEGLDGLISRADGALYAAKQEGRNRVAA